MPVVHFLQRPHLCGGVMIRSLACLILVLPRLLFETPGSALGWPVRAWDVSHDNQRFPMAK